MAQDLAPVRTPRKAALAAWCGSALEYYDFAIYGTAAALVFPKIFFPEGNETAASIASFATFGVAYVARPIGSFFMGHVGDRLGRKRILIGTLLLMGAEDIDRETFQRSMSIIVKHRTDIDLVAERVGMKLPGAPSPAG